MSRLNITPFITAGLTDGFNPCIFSAIVFLAALIFSAGYRPWRILVMGIFFTAAVFLTSLLVGLDFFGNIVRLEQYFIMAKIFYLGVALAAIVLGIINFYDWFVYRKTNDALRILFKLSFSEGKKAPGMAGSKLKAFFAGILKLLLLISAALTAGFLVVFFQSACTGLIYAPAVFYFATIDLLKPVAAGYLILYSAMFVVPLTVIFFAAFLGARSKRFTAVCKRHLAKVKIIFAAVFLSIGFGLLYAIF